MHSGNRTWVFGLGDVCERGSKETAEMTNQWYG